MNIIAPKHITKASENENKMHNLNSHLDECVIVYTHIFCECKLLHIFKFFPRFIQVNNISINRNGINKYKKLESHKQQRNTYL
jgi:hypothetical protein